MFFETQCMNAKQVVQLSINQKLISSLEATMAEKTDWK